MNEEFSLVELICGTVQPPKETGSSLHLITYLLAKTAAARVRCYQMLLADHLDATQGAQDGSCELVNTPL